MNNLLSDRINNLEESQTIAMSKKSRELQAQGKKVINLSVGEPDFNTPDFSWSAIAEYFFANYD